MIDLDPDEKMARCRRRKTAIPPPSLVRDELHWSNELPAETGRKPPLRPLAGGEGGARRGCTRRVRWVARLFGTGGSPHLTPTLSAPKGGEGIFRPPVSFAPAASRDRVEDY